MARAKSQFEHVEVESRAAWRAWLRRHHGQRASIWLVTFKKSAGKRWVPYDAVVEEAICFGWIDSLPRALDEERTMLLLSPRKAGSPWSGLNKRRVAKLEAAGLIEAPGRAVIERAKADGSWTLLDDVEALTVPEDLREALGGRAGATARFAAFSPSSRKGILWWIKSAKAEGTRRRRVNQTAALAAMGLRANFPESRGKATEGDVAQEAGAKGEGRARERGKGGGKGAVTARAARRAKADRD